MAFEEARLEEVGSGLAPVSPGSFVVNVGEAAWLRNDAFGGRCVFESSPRVLAERPGRRAAALRPRLGFTLAVLEPGKPTGMYHAESEPGGLPRPRRHVPAHPSRSRIAPLRAWDFVHCPPATRHTFVGTGDGPCVIFMTGARREGGTIVYPRLGDGAARTSPASRPRRPARARRTRRSRTGASAVRLRDAVACELTIRDLQLDAARMSVYLKRDDRIVLAGGLDRAARLPLARDRQHPRRAGRPSRRPSRSACRSLPVLPYGVTGFTAYPGSPTLRDVDAASHVLSDVADSLLGPGIRAGARRERPRRQHRTGQATGRRRRVPRIGSLLARALGRAGRTQIAVAIDPGLRPRLVVGELPVDAGFPGVAMPERCASLRSRWPADREPRTTWREALGDGSFGGLYQRFLGGRRPSLGGCGAERSDERLEPWVRRGEVALKPTRLKVQATASSRSRRRSQSIGSRRLLYSLRPVSSPERGHPMSIYETPTDSLDLFLRDAVAARS